MLEEPDSKYQPTISLRSDGSLMLQGKVLTLYKHRTLNKQRTPPIYKQAFITQKNNWDSCVVQNIFPGPTDSEPRSMLQFVRDCMFWMQSLPLHDNVKEGTRKIALRDGLIILAVQLGKEKYEMNVSTEQFSGLQQQATLK
jgi:hypothetical protein